MSANGLVSSEAGLFFVFGEYSNADEVGALNSFLFIGTLYSSGKGGKYLDIADAVCLALSGNQRDGNGSDCDHLAQDRGIVEDGGAAEFCYDDRRGDCVFPFRHSSRDDDNRVAANEQSWADGGKGDIFLLHDADVLLLVCLF
jgi:hypothetical protein